ncbi:MAG: GntG family PLP-dependent aldolase [Pirellulaceae bacterium]|jgi:threonine aldolase|nr:GntG family PLP-dependent aldolase [Pirellulaceae bacterium]MDP7020089.1 GntG family PLP-dependent aldolase [Pirellulaceae bacterium]
MRRAIAEALVDDDVIDVDPTVDQLQKYTAELLGKEAAIFMPSGTMTNQIAIRIHCKPGDEFLCERFCHIFNYEQAAFAQLSGVVAQTVPGDAGVLHVDQLRGLIRADNDHLVRTRLVCLENTHNRAGGRVQPHENVSEICQWAHDNGLRTHLDGARLFNAVAASGIEAAEWGRHFDTVSVCFSKGLGAPVGSALAGSAELIREARRHRKLFGGGMRQAGVIAAGALYALRHHRQLLPEDHAKAQTLAGAVIATDGLELTAPQVESNIVIFRVDSSLSTAAAFAATLEEQGVRMLSLGPDIIRAVTHLDVTANEVEKAAQVLRQTAHDLASGMRQPATGGVSY